MARKERFKQVTGAGCSPGGEKIARANERGTTHAYYIDWLAITRATYILEMKASTFRVFSCCIALAGASCAAPRRPSTPAPAQAPPVPLIPAAIPSPNPKLPPVPAVRGPLQITVTYPKPEQLLTVRDSNFIFGTVGTGDAALRINGVAVPVWPNGAFMGWLPVPPDSAAPVGSGTRSNTAGPSDSRRDSGAQPQAPSCP